MPHEMLPSELLEQVIMRQASRQRLVDYRKIVR